MQHSRYSTRICDTLTLNGYTDWFFHQKANLTKCIFKNLWRFILVYIWVQWYDISTAWTQHFTNGARLLTRKAWTACAVLSVVSIGCYLPIINTPQFRIINRCHMRRNVILMEDECYCKGSAGILLKCTTANSHTTDGSGTGAFVSNPPALLRIPNNVRVMQQISWTGLREWNEFTALFYTPLAKLWRWNHLLYWWNRAAWFDCCPKRPGHRSNMGCFGTLIGATGTAIGTGQANTTIIVTTRTGTAAQICDALVLNVKWLVFTIKDELNQMYLQKSIIGGFAYSNYWSSSEYNASTRGTSYSPWLTDGGTKDYTAMCGLFGLFRQMQNARCKW